jgi:hypothetical protein
VCQRFAVLCFYYYCLKLIVILLTGTNMCMNDKLKVFFFFCFLFFLLVKDYIQTSLRQSKRGTCRRGHTASIKNRGRKDENVARKKFSCGPMCHRMSIKVCIFIDFSSFSLKASRDGINNVVDKGGDKLVLSDI